MEDGDERAREGSLNFAGAGIWLMPCKREREGERRRERKAFRLSRPALISRAGLRRLSRDCS